MRLPARMSFASRSRTRTRVMSNPCFAGRGRGALPLTPLSPTASTSAHSTTAFTSATTVAAAGARPATDCSTLACCRFRSRARTSGWLLSRLRRYGAEQPVPLRRRGSQLAATAGASRASQRAGLVVPAAAVDPPRANDRAASFRSGMACRRDRAGRSDAVKRRRGGEVSQPAGRRCWRCAWRCSRWRCA